MKKLVAQHFGGEGDIWYIDEEHIDYKGGFIATTWNDPDGKHAKALVEAYNAALERGAVGD